MRSQLFVGVTLPLFCDCQLSNIFNVSASPGTLQPAGTILPSTLTPENPLVAAVTTISPLLVNGTVSTLPAQNLTPATFSPETLPAIPVTTFPPLPINGSATTTPVQTLPAIPITTLTPLPVNGSETTTPIQTLPAIPVTTLPPLPTNGSSTPTPVQTLPAIPVTSLPPLPVNSSGTTIPVATTPPITGGCGSSLKCPEGQFCSRASQQCKALTCAAWSKEAPIDEFAYSEKPCIAEGFEAGHYFCGWDGKCYQYDCSNWYTLGPVSYTGYDPIKPVPLNCRAFSDGNETHMNSVTYGCRPWQPGTKAPDSQSHILYFNEKCDAKPRPNHTFQCYQNLPGTDYTRYQDTALQRKAPTCDPAIYYTSQPLYWYNVQARQERKGIVTNYKNGVNSTINTQMFDAALATRAFYAVVTSSVDAPPQTYPPPPTQPPTVPVEESSVLNIGSGWKSIVWTLVAVVPFLLL